MGTWQDVILREIARHWEPGEQFTRAEWLQRSLPVFKEEFPDNNSLEESAQNAIQGLRDHGLIEFVSPGLYRRPATAAAVQSVTDIGSEASTPPDWTAFLRWARTLGTHVDLNAQERLY